MDTRVCVQWAGVLVKHLAPTKNFKKGTVGEGEEEEEFKSNTSDTCSDSFFPFSLKQRWLTIVSIFWCCCCCCLIIHYFSFRSAPLNRFLIDVYAGKGKQLKWVFRERVYRRHARCHVRTNLLNDFSFKKNNNELFFFIFDFKFPACGWIYSDRKRTQLAGKKINTLGLILIYLFLFFLKNEAATQVALWNSTDFFLLLPLPTGGSQRKKEKKEKKLNPPTLLIIANGRSDIWFDWNPLLLFLSRYGICRARASSSCNRWRNQTVT